jgi:hypothetical protein
LPRIEGTESEEQPWPSMGINGTKSKYCEQGEK